MERDKTSSHRKTNFSLVWILLALKFSRSKTCLILNIQKNVQFLFRCYGIENKNKTSIFLKYVLLRYFFIFQHGEKDFKYKWKWNILTFEITLIILAYMIRELFTQNNSFLLLVFFIYLFLFYLFIYFFFVSLFLFFFNGHQANVFRCKSIVIISSSRKMSAIMWLKFRYFWKFYNQNKNSTRQSVWGILLLIYEKEN